MTKLEFTFTPKNAFNTTIGQLNEGDFFVHGDELYYVGDKFSSFVDSYRAIRNMSRNTDLRQRDLKVEVIVPTDLVITPKRM